MKCSRTSTMGACPNAGLFHPILVFYESHGRERAAVACGLMLCRACRKVVRRPEDLVASVADADEFVYGLRADAARHGWRLRDRIDWAAVGSKLAREAMRP